MKKKHVKLFTIIVVFVGVWLLFNQGFSNPKKEFMSLETKEATTITYEDGDFIYIPSDNEIAHDSNESIFFYKNILDVFLISEISDEQIKELENIVDGNIVGRLQGVLNILQIQVEGNSLEELNLLIERLKEIEFVEFADFSVPTFVSNLNSNGVGDSTSKIDKEWWAETIDAYTAWQYVEDNPQEFDKVKVAIIESGNLDETDIAIKNELKSVFNKEQSDDEVEAARVAYEENGPNHATSVTKIITANRESKGMRGVATDVANVEFRSIGKEVGALLIMNEIKLSIKNSDLTIINISWGDVAFSKKLFDHIKNNITAEEYKDKYDRILNLTYEEYLESLKNGNDKISATLIRELNKLLKSGKNNFLIVQAAGNGFQLHKEEKPSLEYAREANLTGYFANINDNTLKIANTWKTQSNKIILEDILNHIIVVGGAEKIGNSYQSPVWAGFGEAVDIAAPAANLDINGISKDVLDWGTSYATPQVSGTAAMIWSYNPHFTAGKVKQILLNASKIGVDENKGEKNFYPMLNMNAFMSNYSTLIGIYRTAISEQWGPDELDDKHLGLIVFGSPSHNPSDDYGYKLMDINNDEIDEMIIGYKNDDGQKFITEIYTLVNGNPKKIFTGGLRNHFASIYPNGIIEESAPWISHGNFLRSFSELNKDGNLELKTGYIIDVENETYESLIEPDQYMSEQEIYTLNHIYGEVIDINFKPFLNKD